MAEADGAIEVSSPLADDSLLAVAAQAEKRIEAVNKIKKLALRVTNPLDWCDQQGKPYLQVSGSEKVARLFGISWRIDEPVFEPSEEGHFSYTYKGYFTLGGATIEAIGTRSSKDGFFKRYGKDADGKRVELPASEIDKGDVKKGSYTNCIGNGITRLLGIRNLTYEDLKAANIDTSKLSKVEYGNQEMSAEGRNLKAEAHEMLVSMYGENYGAELEKITAWTNKEGKSMAGKRSLDGVTEKAMSVVYGKIKELYEKKQKASAGEARDYEKALKDCATLETLDFVWGEFEATKPSGPDLVKTRRIRDARAQELKKS